MSSTKLTPDGEVNLFKDFLRLRTMHPNPDLKGCVAWLQQQADEMGMTQKVIEFVPGLPVVVQTRLGSDPSLPSIGLNCHMDVVPVVAEKWDKIPKTEDPFTAWEDNQGNIYARGSQDMKCVGAGYLCALRRLGDTKLLRTLHLIWVPDEEIGGRDGMMLFVKSPEFKELNMGVALDEGLAHDDDRYVVFTGERTALWAQFKAVGPVGHASKLIDKTAFDRLSRVITRLTDIRDENVLKLLHDPELKAGDVTTINITVVQGGTTNDGGKTFAPNVIPSDFLMIADVRVALHDYKFIVAELKALAKEHDLEFSYTNKFNEADGPSPYSDTTTIWWQTIEKSLSQWGAMVEKTIFPAATDARYMRRVGLPAFGFSPMRNTPSLLHDHNEYLNRKVFVEGVEVYVDLISQLANVPGNVNTGAMHKL